MKAPSDPSNTQLRREATVARKRHKNDSSQDENTYEYEKRRKKNMRRSIACNRGMQAQYDAAGKRRGDRYGRQPHGTLRNLTKVSM